MKNTVLLIIDLQNDYFPEGKFPLDNILSVSQKSEHILSEARKNNIPIIHVQHQFPIENAPFFVKETEGVKINKGVQPLNHEIVVTKNFPNAFKDTILEDKLNELQCKHLVVIGAMAQMCVDATVRAALDMGYQVTAIHDAIASRPVQFLDTDVPAPLIQASIMWALSFAGASVIESKEFISQLENH